MMISPFAVTGMGDDGIDGANGCVRDGKCCNQTHHLRRRIVSLTHFSVAVCQEL
ncbi:MAG: hypothetical protein KHW87_05655 [Clostridiales bacterium]|nr:hypothetical protein [Clostridiales bacterium]